MILAHVANLLVPYARKKLVEMCIDAAVNFHAKVCDLEKVREHSKTHNDEYNIENAHYIMPKVNYSSQYSSPDHTSGAMPTHYLITSEGDSSLDDRVMIVGMKRNQTGTPMPWCECNTYGTGLPCVHIGKFIMHLQASVVSLDYICL